MCSLTHRVLDAYLIPSNSHHINLTRQKQETKPYVNDRLQFGCKCWGIKKNAKRKISKMLKDIISEIMSVIIYISTLGNFPNFLQLYDIYIYILYN